ncbi:MAG TPA: double-strand break repair helicase AddA [Rhizobiaceae bacterium]|nr:double-strand break repair helicase AddA [Rhizobiaceae bacterium]
MTKPRIIPAEILELQAKASDPAQSVWVSANAGSGKTHVLSQRVIRLLLNNVEPSKILCLTYTRAAAANMANRVFGQLSEWATLPDEELAKRITTIEGREPGHRKLIRARQLFADALETPGGLKIQTIHAFCEAILHQFPLEANIAGHFEMLDGAMEAALFGEARRDVVSGVVAANDLTLEDAFATILSRAGEFGLDTLLSEIVAKRDQLRVFLDAIAPVEDTNALLEEFGFDADETAGSIAATAWPLPGFSAGEFSALVANANATGATQVLNNIIPNAERAFRETDPEKRLSYLVLGFLKKTDDEPYAASTFKKALLARMPDLLDRYAAAVNAIMKTADRLALFQMLEGTKAALVLADRMIGRYERLKSARGFLDFNDLINRTVRLLAREDVGPWIHYKLDQGIDHILLDEAQDTSPDQWLVVRRLAEEFFTGLGARERVSRTVFAVGDEKQSIYSFQGADPAGFDESRLRFSAKAQAARASFEEVKLTWSFRSTDDVLSAIDTVFANAAARQGLTHDPLPIGHRAIRAGEPGYVELWPSIGATTVQEPEDWREAVDHASAPAVRLAEHIALTVKSWLDKGEMLEGQGRKISAGDVLVLVRKRDRFIHALSRSLKDKQIAVAGADRLSLRGHIAVQDMMALGRFVVQPEDDLSLAALLRSPVFGLSEEQLYALAAKRPRGMSLHASLKRSAEGDLILHPIAAQLNAWQNEAAFKPVFEFYAGVLGRDGIRRKMIARLGNDAGDILDEFLSFCLAEEKTGLPGLDVFLETLENSAPEIRREMDQGRDEVRIMTTHAAKGLEAPIVFLVDSGSAPFSTQHLPRLMPMQSRKGVWDGDGYVWRSGVDVKNTHSEAAEGAVRDKAEEEYRRLLYVGLTRAEDRLIVCGYHNQRPPAPGNWHSLVDIALRGSPHVTEHVDPIFDGSVLRYRVSEASDIVPANQNAGDARPATLAAPVWLATPLPPELIFPRPLSPSGASALIDDAVIATVSKTSPVLDPVETPSFAIERGLAIHKLLQVLPSLPVEIRRVGAERYIARVGSTWDEAERVRAAESVWALLEDPQFAPIFAETSRAEVSVMGHLPILGAERAVSGTIDRLAITADEVLIVDYKTNRPPPKELSEVPEAYVLQLALYRALLQPLYPDRRVSAGLLFTESPSLMAVPSEAMEAALARLT